jgi:broad specificity phosphatase PhoE
VTTLLLIRHGHTEAVGAWMAGYLPVSIDERGREQARRLAERLASRPIDAIYASPLDRTRQTAEPLAAARGLPILDLPDVGEFRMGEWDGKRFADLDAGDARWRRFNRFRSLTRAPGGELMVEVQARMVAGLLRVAAAHPGGTVAVFSHADPIRAAILYFTGRPIDDFHAIEVHPASVTTIEVPVEGAVRVAMEDA